MDYKCCRYCNSVCSTSCFREHRDKFRCHDRRCPGHEVPLERRASTRDTRGYSYSTRDSRAPRDDPRDLLQARDGVTGEYYQYHRDPNKDRAHLECCRALGPPKPGFRYGYNKRGDIVSFAVLEGAKDYLPSYSKGSSSRNSSSRNPSGYGSGRVYAENDRSDGRDRHSRRKSHSEHREHHSRRHSESRSHHHHHGHASGHDDRYREHRRHDKDYRRGESSGRRGSRDKSRGPLLPYEIESPPASPDKKHPRAGDDWEIESVVSGTRNV
ncbi:hypothetical protein F4778DRAFT_729199 [Xylariomycetidae sp. FL2044]|nr:hypothetical protein F4778DRAFT_729199 [Xylariomycetidae sp. FL2044]